MGLFNFLKKNKSKTSLNQAQALVGTVIVSGYRKIATANDIAPTSKTSDQKILEIYQQVGSAFREASTQRNEHIPAGHMNTVVLKFYQLYELMGEEMFSEHLKYEVDKYLHQGLRQDYQQDLKLI